MAVTGNSWSPSAPTGSADLCGRRKSRLEHRTLNCGTMVKAKGVGWKAVSWYVRDTTPVGQL